MQEKSRYFCRLFPLLLLIFIDSFSFFVVIPILLKIFYHAQYGLLAEQTTLSVRNTLTGVTIALSMAAALLFAPFVGRASDHFGRKKTLLGCIGCIVAGFLLPLLGIIYKSVPLILIGRFISGIGSASQPVAQAAVADVCQGEHERARYLSLVAVMMTLALILGPLAGGFLSQIQVTTPFIASLLLSSISFLLVVFFFHETVSTKNSVNMMSFGETVAGLPKLMRSYRIAGLIGLFFCLELGWSQYYQSIDLFLQLRWHLSLEHISVFSAALGIVMAIGLLFIYPFLLRVFSLREILGASMVCVMVGLLCCAFFPFLQTQWVFGSLVAFGTGIAYVSILALISTIVAAKEQGLLMGYLSTLLYLAWMLTGMIGNMVLSWHLSLPLYMAAGFLIVGYFFGFLGKKYDLDT